MKIQTLSMGPIGTNCYVVYNEKKEAIIFDPSGEATTILSFLKDESLTPIAICLTHAHWDHIWGLEKLHEILNVPVYLHKKEQNWLEDASLNGSSRFGFPALSMKIATEKVTHEMSLVLGNFKMNCLHLPGHSPGSVGYYFAEQNIIVSGDVLFEGSVGRTDLKGSNPSQLESSIVTLYEKCALRCTVYPGHGMPTTLEKEKRWNPYVSQFLR
ncbi:MAG: MBL fold metallo-hydrolase [Bacilli bacterium]